MDKSVGKLILQNQVLMMQALQHLVSHANFGFAINGITLEEQIKKSISFLDRDRKEDIAKLAELLKTAVREYNDGNIYMEDVYESNNTIVDGLVNFNKLAILVLDNMS